MPTLRIAMWSGPRNISTAMMRSFGARADCAVSDEPFYGCFLATSGADHPMAAEIVAAMVCDWRSVAAAMAGPAPGGRAVWYQKQMNHHMIGPVAPDDLAGVVHAFLIRDPARTALSYRAKRETVSADDLGTAAQAAFFAREADRLGHAPPVVDAADILADPAGTLSALCAALGLAWDPAMLRWAPGRRPSDGIWASHWYARVEASTGFEPPPADTGELDDDLQAVAKACRPHYQAMAAHRLTGGRE